MTTTLTLPPTVIEKALYTDPHLQSGHTRRQYLSNLERFEDWRHAQGSPPLTKMLVEAYAATLQRAGLAPTTINQKLASIRWWARKMVDFAFEWLEPTQAQRISEQAARVVTVEDVKGDSPQAGRHLRQAELVKLLRVCLKDGSPAGIRDAALFAVVWTTGLRRAELARLKIEDLEVTGEGEADLLVHGKGNKHRTAFLFNGAFEALANWLEIRGDNPGPIFCQIRKNGTVVPERGLTGEALRKIVEKRLARTPLKHLTWHDFRRTFAGNLFDGQNDIATVQQLMGHASPTTTSNYDRRPERTRRQAVKKLHIPLPEVKARS